ncbi:MAG: hypothetical protein RR257_02735 [Rikenellaceae bacterium]
MYCVSIDKLFFYYFYFVGGEVVEGVDHLVDLSFEGDGVGFGSGNSHQFHAFYSHAFGYLYMIYQSS